jgi:ribosomal protein S18 acetylase RimI-like enzyme
MIRTANIGDVNRIIEFGRETFLEAFGDHPLNNPNDVTSYLDEAFTVEAVTNEINDPDSTFFLAETDSTLVGYAKIKQNVVDNGVTGSKPMEICRIYVSKKLIGKGIGKELMLKCLKAAEENKNDVVWLGVWEFNPTAQEFYKKFGFSRCGEHVFQLGSDPQTDWIFQLHL